MNWAWGMGEQESRNKNSLMEFKASLMELKDSLMEFKHSLMELKDSLMEFKHSLMKFEASLMEFKDSLTSIEVNSSNKFTIAVGFDFAQPTQWSRVEQTCTERSRSSRNSSI